MTVTYCIDSSSFIDAGERYYPSDVFPTFWTRIDELVTDGRLKAPAELIDELAAKAEKWRDWVYARKEKIIVSPDESLVVATKQVVSEYTRQASSTFNPDRLSNDVFFIALAKSKGYTLITSELPKKGGYKIPKICDAQGVRWVPLLGMVRSERWTF